MIVSGNIVEASTSGAFDNDVTHRILVDVEHERLATSTAVVPICSGRLPVDEDEVRGLVIRYEHRPGTLLRFRDDPQTDAPYRAARHEPTPFRNGRTS